MSSNDQLSIAIIDDKPEPLAGLVEGLTASLGRESVRIRTWLPADGQNPLEKFEGLVDDGTILVVTDHDLTGAGATGLWGQTIVSWCQAKSIPCGDFSREIPTTLSSEPNLFELRVPPTTNDAVASVASLFRGFRQIRDRLGGGALSLSTMRSPAEVLAGVIERPALEAPLSLYMSRLGAANASLLDQLRRVLSQSQVDNAAEKERLIGYVIGHVLVNSVLRYPGPILAESALCAYIATTEAEAADLRQIFDGARYEGPFSSNTHFFWRAGVDAIVDSYASTLGDQDFATSGAYNRAVVESVLKRSLARHACSRCNGDNGGYLCPFTRRSVCERRDCSVSSNSWLPAGADICRIERDFYDEWAPALGL
jgi:hypothetical protein